MVDVQKENGYMVIANELVEALARIRISGVAMQILLVILRKTYGFNKTKDHISNSQFSRFTGLKRPHVCRALNKLSVMNVIIINKGNKKGDMYSINKQYDSWQSLPKKITLPIKIQKVINNGISELSLLGHTKDTLTKDIIQKTYMYAWNSMCKTTSAFNEKRKLNTSITNHIKKRTDETKEFYADYLSALVKIEKDTFLHKEKWLNFEFMFLIQKGQSGVYKILEGKYDFKKQNKIEEQKENKTYGEEKYRTDYDKIGKSYDVD